MPYKFIAIVAGVATINLLTFTIAPVIGQSWRPATSSKT